MVKSEDAADIKGYEDDLAEIHRPASQSCDAARPGELHSGASRDPLQLSEASLQKFVDNERQNQMAAYLGQTSFPDADLSR